MSQMSTLSTPGLGNTRPNPPVTKKRHRGKSFTLTWNNYTEDDYVYCLSYVQQNCNKYIIGKEIAPETGTPHLQMYMLFKNQIDFSKIKKDFPSCHIEQARGTALDNLNYCSKESDFVTNIEPKIKELTQNEILEKLKLQVLEEEYKNVIWKDWQQDIINMLDEPTHPRMIQWYWEPTGNVGKTFLCKYLACTRNIIIADGKKADIFNQVLQTILETKQAPSIILLDCPRSAEEYINYGVIEQLKNGLAYSGKYEGGKLVFPRTKVICFSNSPPDELALSKDMWNIVRIQ